MIHDGMRWLAKLDANTMAAPLSFVALLPASMQLCIAQQCRITHFTIMGFLQTIRRRRRQRLRELLFVDQRKWRNKSCLTRGPLELVMFDKLAMIFKSYYMTCQENTFLFILLL